jgi:hypothetical protein
MYRHIEDPFENDHEAELPGSGRRHFAPVPLGIVGGLIALAAEFFALFLLAWGMAPTSVGCGAGRAFAMSGSMLAIGVGIYVIVAGVGIGIMGDARETESRRRAFLITFTAMYVLGSLPLLALAPLFGSCFDF